MATMSDGKAAARRTMSWCRTSITTGILGISAADGHSIYLVEEIGSQVGRSFKLDKLDGEKRQGAVYRCHLSGTGQQACDCPAGRWRGLCRHTAALRKLLDTGRIAGGLPGAGNEESSDA